MTPPAPILIWKFRADGEIVSLLIEINLVLAQEFLSPVIARPFNLPENVHYNLRFAGGPHFNGPGIHIHHQSAPGSNGKGSLNICLYGGSRRYAIWICNAG